MYFIKKNNAYNKQKKCNNDNKKTSKKKNCGDFLSF